MSPRFRVEGLKDLDRALGQFKIGAAKGVLRRTAIEALTPIAETARDLAPDDPSTPAPNDLKSSIAISPRQKSSRFSARGDLGTSVQMYVGPTGPGYPQAMVQEFGAKPHAIKPRTKGKARGKAKLAFEAGGQGQVVGEVQHPGHAPHPFMRPAWDQHRDQLLPRVAEILWRQIRDTAGRIAKRAASKAAKSRGG